MAQSKKPSSRPGKRRKKKAPRTGWILLAVVLSVLIGLAWFAGKGVPKRVLRETLEKIGIIKKPLIRPLVKEVFVDLFFSDDQGGYLVSEKRKIQIKGPVSSMAKQVVLELIKGPKTRLIRTLPAQTVIKAIRIDKEGTAFVDFDQSIKTRHPGGSSAEILSIYSIVNSLTRSFHAIKRVQILVDGKPIDTLAGHISCRRTFEFNKALVKGSSG